MPRLEINPVTGQLDLVRSSGGGASDTSQVKVTKTASENISALQLVIADGETGVLVAEKNSTFQDAQVLGIALNAATTGNDVEVVTFGEVSDPTFSSLTENNPIFLGDNGSIIQSVTAGDFLTEVGKSIGGNGIFVTIKQPIELC